MLGYPSGILDLNGHQLVLAIDDKVNFGSGGNGVTNHLAMELLRSTAGLDMVHVPYKGGPPALTALIAGDVQVMFETGPGALPHVKSGKLKAIAVGSARRSGAAPEVPTVAESGLPGFEAIAWICMAAPAGTPQPIVNKLNQEVNEYMASAEFRGRLAELWMQAIGGPPERVSAMIASESEKWKRIIDSTGVKLD